MNAITDMKELKEVAKRVMKFNKFNEPQIIAFNTLMLEYGDTARLLKESTLQKLFLLNEKELKRYASKNKLQYDFLLRYVAIEKQTYANAKRFGLELM